MEVHPPEHGIHSWRDFLVHMCTNCLGLLLANGLEQSVEALHHRHIVHELQLSLREESQRNQHNALVHYRNLDAHIAALSKSMEGLSAYLRDGTPLPPRAAGSISEEADSPANPVWSAARASGWLAFVPEDMVKAYAEIDTGVTEWDKAGDRALIAAAKMAAYGQGLCGVPCVNFDPSKVSPAELRQYLTLMAELNRAYLVMQFMDQFLYGAESAILRGETSLEAIQKAEREPVPARTGETAKEH